jgi:Zn-dependent protease with chaperone function
MNFFEAQDRARARTRTLAALFVAAVIGIIVASYTVLHLVLGPGPRAGVNFGLLAAVAIFTTGLIAAGSLVRTMQLRQGGPRVAELLGGRRIRSNTADAAERRLMNIVEEMAIAAGMPVPAIYVLDRESGINAFAAGFTLDDAAVAVTRGTLDRLNRDELQGVIAHEFSHILNGDMRLNIRLIGILFGILLLAVVGRGLLHSGGGQRGGREGGAQLALLGLGLIAIGYIGVLFGRLIQAAVSRQREFLADAAAVQYTRNPDGIAGALKKIGRAGSRIEDYHAQEASHLFFANGLGSPFATLLATHPPLEERIRRIDPRFAGRPAAPGAPHPERRHAGAAGAVPPPPVPLAPAGAVTGAALLASIGAPQPEHIAYAGRLLDALPLGVVAAAHDPAAAPALLYALLLHGDGDADTAQREILTAYDAAVLAESVRLARELQPLGHATRLPVLELLLPALRELSADERARVRATAQRLVTSDQRLDMFEFALIHVMNRQLADTGTGRHAPGPEPVPIKRFAALRADIEIILSATAWSGTTDLAAARTAFMAGSRNLYRQTGPMDLRRRSTVDLAAVDGALGRARAALPAIRHRILEACTLVAAQDGWIHTQEAELLRAVAEAIDCPMPPVMQVAAPRRQTS